MRPVRIAVASTPLTATLDEAIPARRGRAPGRRGRAGRRGRDHRGRRAARGSLPTKWCGAANPYNEKALLCRALENTVYVAAANTAGPDQGSATVIIGPDGQRLAGLPYGPVGVVAAELDLAAATGRLARRWAPDRNVIQ